MVKRTYWMNLIEKALKHRPILWLRGVRRSGKTFLCKSITGVTYFDCEMPEARRYVSNEIFLKENTGKTIVLDEIHKLDDPAGLLKVAADHHPGTKIIATGSSSLETIKKFSDTLTGRKSRILLTPVISAEYAGFGAASAATRMLNGGLPPFLSSKTRRAEDYNEWIDSYWARDIMGLFKLEKRDSFMKLMELVFNDSGCIFDAGKFAAACEVSRQTIKNYLSVLETTSAVYVIRPYSGRNLNEIVARPKVYCFDTGFMAFIKGWDALRQDDYGIMWEHLVLNELTAALQNEKVFYWRDKQGHEVDFVVKSGRDSVDAIECKWKSESFDPANMKIFRNYHPGGTNYVVSHDAHGKKVMEKKGLKVTFTGIEDIIELFGKE